MVKRFVPIPVITFCLLVACEALGQSDRPSTDLLQRDGSNTHEAPRQEMRAWGSLPDSPSAVQRPKQAEKFSSFVGEARSPSALGAPDVNSERSGTELDRITPESQRSFSASYETGITQEDNFVGKYLFPPLPKQNPLYHPSTSSSFMGRATYSASRIFITRDDSGKLPS